MEKYSNKRKYGNFYNDDDSTKDEDYYRDFTYYELAEIFRYKILEGGQLTQKIKPFLDEFNSAEYYKILKKLITLGFDKVDLERIKGDIEKIKKEKVKELKAKYLNEYKEKIKNLGGYEEEEEEED